MVLWGISRHRDRSGLGSLKAAGRWHSAGHPIVYVAETPAAALLEVCVHTSANDVPLEFTLLKIQGSDFEVPSINFDSLPEDWRTQLEVTRDTGTAWLEKNEGVLLRVPSAIVPETMNCLFNPARPFCSRRIKIAGDSPANAVTGFRIKRFTFVEAAEHDSEFATELPAFVANVM